MTGNLITLIGAIWIALYIFTYLRAYERMPFVEDPIFRGGEYDSSIQQSIALFFLWPIPFTFWFIRSIVLGIYYFFIKKWKFKTNSNDNPQQ